MKKAGISNWVIALACAAFGQVSLAGEAPGATASPPDVSADEVAELQAQMEAASAQLDAAARRLAELHRERGDTVHFVAAASAALNERPLLGVLLGERRGDGIEIVAVTPGGGAEAAGLSSGDVLLSIDGKPIEGSAESLMDGLADRDAGASVDVEYERAGERATVAVELRPGGPHWAMAAPFEIEVEPMNGGVFVGQGFVGDGVRLVDLDSDLASYFGVDSGVLLVRAPADVEALKSGDVIRTIDDVPVTDANELRRRLHDAGGDVSLDVVRHGEVVRLELNARSLAGPGPFGSMSHGAVGARLIRSPIDEADVQPVPPAPPGAPAQPARDAAE
jgi:S1-C subfamily serine protease